MPVIYVLHPNPLTNNPDHQRAMVRHSNRYTMENIIDRMISRGSTVTKADVLSVIEEYEAAVTALLAEGGSIQTPLLRIALSISGVFEGREDHFDPDRHSLNVNLSSGPRMQQLHEQITLQKVNGKPRCPALDTFVDFATNSRNQVITPGSAGMIRGNLLKMDLADPSQGLFICGSDGSELRVSSFIRHKPKELLFIVPESVPPAPLALEVRSTIRYTTEIRTGRLDTSLHLA